MGENSKKIPLNSIGKIIKEARLKKKMTEEELSWRFNDPKVTIKLIKAWEKGQEFPDLNMIYKLAEFLELDPNELLKIRVKIQDESIKEVNWSKRRLGGATFVISKSIIQFMVRWLGVILAIMLAFYAKRFIELMQGDPGGEQEKMVVRYIESETDKWVNKTSDNIIE